MGEWGREGGGKTKNHVFVVVNIVLKKKDSRPKPLGRVEEDAV